MVAVVSADQPTHMPPSREDYGAAMAWRSRADALSLELAAAEASVAAARDALDELAGQEGGVRRRQVGGVPGGGMGGGGCRGVRRGDGRDAAGTGAGLARECTWVRGAYRRGSTVLCAVLYRLFHADF